MNTLYRLLFGSPQANLNANEARKIAENRHTSHQNQCYQECMKEIQIATKLGHFETCCPTQDAEVINKLRQMAFQVKKVQYSDDEDFGGMVESFTRDGIEISWRQP